MGSNTSKKAESEKSNPNLVASQETINKIQEKTHFNKVEVSALYKTFMELSDNGKHPLNKAQFEKGLSLLEKCGLAPIDTPFANRLFEQIDLDKNGTLDIQEFVSGLSMLCKGSIDEKLELSFKIYDLDGNGFIEKHELEQMFKQAWISGFQTLSADQGQHLSAQDLNQFAAKMARLFTDQAFDKLDTNKDGKLDLQEFKEFALAEPKITATVNGYSKEVAITF